MLTRTYNGIVVDGSGNLVLRLVGLGGSNNYVLASGLDVVATGPPLETLAVSIIDAEISENGGSTTATVTRSGDTTNALIVDLASDDTGEATVPPTVTIAAGQATSPSFTITGVDDAISDGTQTVTITASVTAGGYSNGTETLDVTDDEPPPAFEAHLDFGTSSSPLEAGYTRVTIANWTNLTAGGDVDRNTGSALDRGTGSNLQQDMNFLQLGTFRVAVPNNTYDVTVTLGDTAGPGTGHDQMGVFLEGTFVDTVTTALGVVVANTYSVTVSDGELTLLLDDLGGANDYVTLLGLDVVLAGPGVSKSQSGGSTDVTEGGAADTYSIALNTLPAGDVQITVTADVQSEVSLDGTNFFPSAVLAFTSLNGTTPQTVSVRAIDDLELEGGHTSTISHAITNTADPTDYPLATTISDVVANVTDNDGITFTIVYQDSAAEGFFDSTLGGARQDAFEYSVNIWAGLLDNSYTNQEIIIEAKMDPLPGNTLASAGPYIVLNSNIPGGFSDTVYGVPLANQVAGFDLLPTTADIVVTMDSDTNWYLGTDGSTPAGQFDFVTVGLHELGHGLNFTSFIESDGSYEFLDSPGIYDRFVENTAGTDLVDMATDAERADALTRSGSTPELFWNGTEGIAGNGGSRPPLYDPSTYEAGSSVSHLDEVTFPTNVMSPTVAPGQSNHVPGDIVLGMLADMGWTVPSVGGGLAVGGGSAVASPSSTVGGVDVAGLPALLAGDVVNFAMASQTSEDLATIYHVLPEHAIGTQQTSSLMHATMTVGMSANLAETMAGRPGRVNVEPLANHHGVTTGGYLVKSLNSQGLDDFVSESSSGPTLASPAASDMILSVGSLLSPRMRLMLVTDAWYAGRSHDALPMAADAFSFVHTDSPARPSPRAADAIETVPAQDAFFEALGGEVLKRGGADGDLFDAQLPAKSPSTLDDGDLLDVVFGRWTPVVA